MIKTKTGLADEYIKQITGTVKPVYDEEKKQKVILDYKILNGEASNPHDFNILILVEYPNWAAFDTLRNKMDPVVAKVMGSEEQRKELAVKRLDVREILGTKTMREITLKKQCARSRSSNRGQTIHGSASRSTLPPVRIMPARLPEMSISPSTIAA